MFLFESTEFVVGCLHKDNTKNLSGKMCGDQSKNMCESIITPTFLEGMG
jgi:hypothetical protein